MESMKKTRMKMNTFLATMKRGIKNKRCKITLPGVLKELKLLTPYNIKESPSLTGFDVWHLQVSCMNFQHSVQQYTRHGISEIVKNVEELIDELAARQYWYKIDGDNVKNACCLQKIQQERYGSIGSRNKEVEKFGEIQRSRIWLFHQW